MSRQINQRDFRNQSAEILREVQAGETLIVTRNGTPVAELRPIHQRRFIPRAVVTNAGARAPRIDYARFVTDLDAVVDQAVDD
jgi:prevent-host-death family protein